MSRGEGKARGLGPLALPWLCIAAVSLLGGCVELPPMPQAPTTLPPVQLNAFQAPLMAAYRINIGDQLAIRLPLNPELNDTVTVLQDGSISTSVVHRQVAAGLTLKQLDLALWHDYQSVLNSPIVDAIVVKSAPTPIYILGAVERPGIYDFNGAVPRLAQAIAVAGGLKLGANPSQIFILRQLPDGGQQFFATQFADVKNGRDPAANVPLALSDEIFVPRTTIARAYGYFNQYFQQFIATSASVTYVVNPNGNTSVVPAR